MTEQNKNITPGAVHDSQDSGRPTQDARRKTQDPIRLLISGGGTGGHVFPALAIADAVKKRFPDAVIEFVGAMGRMEMEKVPQHGYKIHGLWISGIQRKKLWKNFMLPFKLLASMNKVRKIVRDFKPDAAIGVGGYASGPLLRAAAQRGIPTLIQEQNSYPGVTNKILAKKASRICVAYPGMDKYFPVKKIVLTGNPVRQFPVLSEAQKIEAYAYFGLSNDRPVILVVGGSLGAGTINSSLLKDLDKFIDSQAQLLWQTGKYYNHDIVEKTSTKKLHNVRIMAFIDRMDFAYGIADIVVSRAGAISISELELVKKPVILVPSPNVAEDHQAKNARTLVEANAALMVRDGEAHEKLADTMLSLLADKPLQKQLAQNIAGFAMPDAADKIVDEVIELVKSER
jgi:UDP-N-acetylglucosamine--N-acetylmuramyl-(pentapeptide) pyrophosphoryl-undecaprenol N-acetylglucosamine transferase